MGGTDRRNVRLFGPAASTVSGCGFTRVTRMLESGQEAGKTISMVSG